MYINLCQILDIIDVPNIYINFMDFTEGSVAVTFGLSIDDRSTHEDTKAIHKSLVEAAEEGNFGPYDVDPDSIVFGSGMFQL